MPSLQSKVIVVPFLGVEGLKYAGAVYVDLKIYLVSPVYGSFKDLAPVTVFIGTREVFLPDCRKLRTRAAVEVVTIDYREYDQMVHNWMWGPMPEAKQVLREIVDRLSG